MIKDKDGKIIASEESVLRRWKKYFEELLNEENEREHRNEEPEKIRKRVGQIRKDEVRKEDENWKSSCFH